MARMLGFSEEDKQRIGVARQGDGKGVVRGVLGLPGRLVGGILGGGGGASEAHSATAPDDQVSLSLSHAHAAHMSFIAICAPMPISVNIFSKLLLEKFLFAVIRRFMGGLSSHGNGKRKEAVQFQSRSKLYSNYISFAGLWRNYS